MGGAGGGVPATRTGVGFGGFLETTGGGAGFSSDTSFFSTDGCSAIIVWAATSASSALFCFLFCSSRCHGGISGSSSFGLGGGALTFGLAFGGGALFGCSVGGVDGGG